MATVALTDHTGMTGALAFYSACKNVGVQPVIGLEIYFQITNDLLPYLVPETSGRLVLLAMNIEGWHNLCRLSSSLSTTIGNQRCTLDQLNLYSEGLLCLTGGNLGPLHALHELSESENIQERILALLHEVFPQRIYVELNHYLPVDDHHNDLLVRLASRLRLPTVATHPVFYLKSDQSSLQETVSAIRQTTTLGKLAPGDVAPKGSFFVSAQEMEKRFSQYPASLASIKEISDRCQLELPLGVMNYPTIPLPPGKSAMDVLRQKAFDGARRMYSPPVPEDLFPRLNRELSVIEAKGYAPIFLIAEDMIGYAKKNGIPFASRGSASSSLVAHCAGITTPDPLELDLYFERFLNPARSSPPDIDTDFCSRRRDDVIRYLFNSYGKERVAMVGTINTFRPRSALGEVAKAHGIAQQDIHALTSKLFHRAFHHNSELQGEEGKAEHPYAELMRQLGNDPRYNVIFEQAISLLGLPHHLSVHPGGVVIAPGPITDYVPVACSGGKGVIITQFDLDDVERVGLVKFDLLGIRGLSVLGDVADRIFSWKRKEYFTAYQVLEDIPQVDAEISNLLSSGKTIGCFQIESPGMRATLKEIHARTPADLMAALALSRPGPLKGGLRDAFVKRHRHEEEVTFLHPALSDLLQETYGVILYQEQVLRIAHELAGFSLAEADLLRRAMSHFDAGKQMQILEEKFIVGAKQNSGIPQEAALRIWNMMSAFSSYGFLKAHAASYAQLAWRSAWCKAYYPAEFIAAVLANWGGYYPQSVYLYEARRLKIPVFPPHINHSQRQFSTCYPGGEAVLYMGLDQVRDLTRSTQERILRYRPFHSLAEFIAKVDPRKVEVENLIMVGAFDGISTIPGLLSELSQALAQPGQIALFSLSNAAQEDWLLEQKNAAQQKIIGASLAAHPLELQAEKIRRAGVLTTLDIASRIGQVVQIAGTRQNFFRNRTAQNEWMGSLTLEDLEGTVDVIVPPDLFRKVRNLLSDSTSPLLIEGTVERDDSSGEPVLFAQRIHSLR